MNDSIWTTTVTRIGDDAQDLIDAGVIILFGDPVPDALADVSVMHRPTGDPERDIRAGDVITIGAHEYPIDDVGDQASKNLQELGHIVLYVNAVDQKLLPGAVHVSGTIAPPAVGDLITVRAA